MLTRLVEGNKRVQANCYWPEEGTVRRFGRLLVYHNKTFVLGEVIVRSLLIREAISSSLDKSSTREIIQLHYEGWPDDGVPMSTKPIRDLLMLMAKFKARSVLQHLDGPVVVHCSAGLGRTGSFIACHITLHKILNNESPNIKRTVELLRKQRHGMVRNQEQYSLIYSVVGDALQTGLLKELSIQLTGPVLRTSAEMELAEQRNED